MNFLLRGFWSGTIATSFMSLWMFRVFELLPHQQKKPLPPAQLTAEITSPFLKTGSELTLVSHFGYGVLCGTFYSAWQARRKNKTARSSSASAAFEGSVFGLAIWGLSYLGWIPALRLSPSATHLSASRNSMMILGHLIWGASLGMTEDSLRRQGHQMLETKKQNQLHFAM